MNIINLGKNDEGVVDYSKTSFYMPHPRAGDDEEYLVVKLHADVLDITLGITWMDWSGTPSVLMVENSKGNWPLVLIDDSHRFCGDATTIFGGIQQYKSHQQRKLMNAVYKLSSFLLQEFTGERDDSASYNYIVTSCTSTKRILYKNSEFSLVLYTMEPLAQTG